MGLGSTLRAVAKTVAGASGAAERVILRTPTAGTYSTSTGGATDVEVDRAVDVVRVKSRRGEAGSTTRQEIRFLLPAQGLYVEGRFRLPHEGDRFVIGCDTIFGDADNPGWDGGQEYEITAMEPVNTGGVVVMYEVTVKR